MTARQWRWALVVMGICAGLANSGSMFAQGTPLTLGPLTVMPPPGWAAQTNVVPVRLFSPDSTPHAFFLSHPSGAGSHARQRATQWGIGPTGLVGCAQ